MESFHGFLGGDIIDTGKCEGFTFVCIEEVLQSDDINGVIVSLKSNIHIERSWFKGISRYHAVDFGSREDAHIPCWFFEPERCEDFTGIFDLESFYCFLGTPIVGTCDHKGFTFVDIEEFLQSHDFLGIISPWRDIDIEREDRDRRARE